MSNYTARGGRGGDAHGGAIYTARGRLELVDTYFLTNRAFAGDGGKVKAFELYLGGNGGDAAGGAIYASSEAAAVNLKGEMDMMDGETEKVYSSSYVFGNAAAGGTGQPGYGNRTGEGGHSGRAHGGAFMIQCPSFTLEGVLAKENTAAGGSGADAKVFVEKKVISDVGGIIISEDIFDHFGRGGDCGDGYGGAVYMTSEETVIVNSVFVTNQATGYGLPPITLLVGSENNGVWKLDVSKDPVYPYGGRATGRVPGTEDNAQGGHGGSAYGGRYMALGGSCGSKVVFSQLIMR